MHGTPGLRLAAHPCFALCPFGAAGELHNVLTVLRLNSQSIGGGDSALGGYTNSEMALMAAEEQSLLRQLKDAYSQICLATDLDHVDTLAYLQPFLTVITSKHTDIFTTAIALHVRTHAMRTRSTFAAPHARARLTNACAVCCPFVVRSQSTNF